MMEICCICPGVPGEVELNDGRFVCGPCALRLATGDDRQKPLPTPSAVSIVMPAYNAAPFIRQAILSVSGQDFNDWELLVIDDGSEDGTAAIVDVLSRNDHRIRFLKQPHLGVSAARNRGIQSASNAFVAFLDADDLMKPGSLKARLTALHAGAEIVHSRAHRIDEHGVDLGRPFGLAADFGFEAMWRNPVHLNTVAGRKDLFAAFAFEDGRANGEDWLWLANVLHTGVRSTYVAKGGAAWRCHPVSTTFAAMERHEQNLLPVIDWVYDNGLTDPPKADVLHQRKNSLLIWALLSGDEDCSARLLSDRNLAAWRARQSASSLCDAITATAVRRFRKSASQLPAVKTATPTVLRAADARFAAMFDDVFCPTRLRSNHPVSA